MNETTEDNSYAEALRGRRTAAAVLLIVAAVALAGPHVPLNWRDGFLALMGVGFIVWSALARSRGLLVPGGVLTGIGVGAMLRPEFGHGAFLLSMAGGFLLIALLAPLLFGRGCRWAFWPAAGLAFAGLIAMAGPEARAMFRELRPLWPWLLIGVAVFLLFSEPARKA